MEGKATLTIEMSRTTMNWARQTMASTRLSAFFTLACSAARSTVPTVPESIRAA